MVHEADLLWHSGKTQEGNLKYEEAWNRLKKIEQQSPDWEPNIVRYPIQYCAERLGRQPPGSESAGQSRRLGGRLSAGAGKSSSTRPLTIGEIEFISRREDIPLNEDKIRQNMRSQKGGEYSLSRVDQDILDLYATGDFENVQILANEMRSDDSEGGVRLTVVLEPKPVLSGIVLTRMSSGNVMEGKPTLGEKDLPLGEFAIGRRVGRELLHRQAVTWENQYRKKGFSEVSIDPLVENRGNGTAWVNFRIYEGPRRLIRKVSFQGNDHVPAEEIKKRILLQPMSPWCIRNILESYDPTQASNDLECVRSLYQNYGFLDVHVTCRVDTLPDGLAMNYEIKEGKRYGVEKITLEGFQELKEKEILKELRENSRNKEVFDQISMKMIKADGLLRGRIYSPLGMQASVQTLQDYYGKHGFREATVAGRFLELEESKYALHVSFKIQEGERSYVDKVLIRGNQKVPDVEIRSKILLAPGDIFDDSKVNRSKESLLATHLFQDVITLTEETENPNRHVLIFEVIENPRELSFGLGVSMIWNGGPERGVILAAPFPFILSFNLSAGWGIAWLQAKKIILDFGAQMYGEWIHQGV